MACAVAKYGVLMRYTNFGCQRQRLLHGVDVLELHQIEIGRRG